MTPIRNNSKNYYHITTKNLKANHHEIFFTNSRPFSDAYGETIYPEVPNDPEMMYIAAKINILSWRLVDHVGAELGW